jgi:glycosyltransferase involved in cell wall biosynthesis
VRDERLSCVICAYNEETRIGHVLSVATRHALLGEVIVVDDGSRDDTALRARAFPQVRLLTSRRNRGKSWALARGIGAARFERLMLLDADLVGLTMEDLDALAAPVLSGAADVALSLRGDSFYRMLGIDFVTGDRVLPRSLLADALGPLSRRTRWGAEVFINELIIAQALRVAVVDWKTVTHASKRSKEGPLRGALADFGMARDIVRELKAGGLLRQNLALWNVVRRTGGLAPRRSANGRGAVS